MAANPNDAQFADLYRRVHPDVLRFIARRLNPPDQARAEDIAHEAFLVAWRRIDDLPSNPNDARAWLFTVARNCLLNDLRVGSRRGALQVRIAADAQAFVPGPETGVGQRIDLAAAWNSLGAADQEVIALTVWDELTSTEAGRVLGISGPAYRLRLHRARNALRRATEPITAPTTNATFAIPS